MALAAAPAFSLIENGTSVPLISVLSPKFPHPCLPFHSKSVEPARSSCYCSSSSFSLKTKLSSSRGPLISLVARTSDWDHEGDEGKNDEEGFDWEAKQSGEMEVSASYWEGEEVDVEGKEYIHEESISEEERERGEVGIQEEDSYSVPPEDLKIFVGNLPYDVESADLAELFHKAGIVETAEVIYSRETDQSRGFGFVTMSTIEEADKAVEMFHRYDVKGRLLTVNKAAPRGSRVERSQEFEPAFRIYVGNLPWDVDDARLEQVFSEHGKVSEARVVYDRDTGRSRGFGFVRMSSQTELDDAIAALDGQSLDGRTMRVSVAEERPRRATF